MFQRPHSVLFLASLTILQLLIPRANANFLIKLKSGEEECFVIRVPGKTPAYISGDFEWIDDLPADPTFVILQDGEFEPVYESPDGAEEGYFSHLGVGTFHLCLSNGIFGGDDMVVGNADGQTRQVAFNFRVREQAKEMSNSNKEGADDEKTTNIMKLSGDVLDAIEFLADHQSSWRAREANQKKLAKSTYRNVALWTLIEAFILVVISGSQVLYFRKFFERKRRL